MSEQDAALGALRSEIVRLGGQMSDVEGQLAEHGQVLVEHGLTLKQVCEALGSLEGRYVSLKECVIRIEGALTALDVTIIGLSNNIGDIKSWMMKLLYLAFVALIKVALGSKAVEVFKMGGL